MELKEYIKILKDNAKIFWGTVALIVAGSFVFFIFRPVSFGTSLSLNITRQGAQETADYKFDDFYRLQADEKFADTIVEWLKSPRIVADIYAEAGVDSRQFTLDQLAKSLKPEKLSSQFVSVGFSVPNEDMAKEISVSIADILFKSTESLNKNQKETTWFEIVAEEPVITKNTFDPFLLLIITLAAGIFIAFWVTLIFHYMK